MESDAGYALRNFMAPVPEVNGYAELNERLRVACMADMHRRPRGKKRTVAELLEEERARLLPIPEQDYPACVSRPAKINPYSQVVLDTNRYTILYRVRCRRNMADGKSCCPLPGWYALSPSGWKCCGWIR